MQKKDIEGFPAYQIYEDGSLFSFHTNKFLTPFKISRGRGSGYWAYKLCQDSEEKTFQIHRLVAMAFIPNPDGLETVNHKDGDTANNHVDNLEWMTQGDNKRHAFETGISEAWWLGEIHPRSSFTNEEVHKICQAFAEGKKPIDLAKPGTLLYNKLYRIYRKQNWKVISQHYDW